MLLSEEQNEAVQLVASANTGISQLFSDIHTCTPWEGLACWKKEWWLDCLLRYNLTPEKNLYKVKIFTIKDKNQDFNLIEKDDNTQTEQREKLVNSR